MSNRKDIKQLIAKLEDQGWDAKKRRRGHYRLAGPSGQITFLPTTPSDYRSIRNSIACLRRLGAKV